MRRALVLIALAGFILVATRPSSAEDPPPCLTFEEAEAYFRENPHITGYLVASNGVIFARVRGGPILFTAPQEGTGCMTRPAPIHVPPFFIMANPELAAGEES